MIFSGRRSEAKLQADTWKKTIFDNNLSDLPNADTCFNTGRIKIAADMAVTDEEATGHFVLPGTSEVDSSQHQILSQSISQMEVL